MAVTVKQVEALPEAWPNALPAMPVFGDDWVGNVYGGDALAWAWQRVEAYIAHRWTPRAVEWMVEGEGDWTPPLTPATVTEAHFWERSGWSAVTLHAGPYGYVMAGEGPYRIRASVGGGEVPPAVLKAVARLLDYGLTQLNKADPDLWATSSSRKTLTENGPVEDSYQRPATWIARALQHSGAADLLRPYRRA